MNMALTLCSWQLAIMLTHSKTYPDLKLPTKDEIKAMVKEAHRRFREVIKKARQPAGKEG